MNKNAIAVSLLGAAILTGVVIHFAHADADDKPTSQPAVAEKPAEAPADSADADKPAPTDSIQTATLRQGDMSQVINAFGSVTAQPGEVAVFSVPYECRVRHINVTAGQPVEKGDALIDVEPSPAARLSLQEAQINLDAANKDLAQTQQRFDMKLATNSDLLQSQQAVQLAQFRLDNLKQQGLEATGDAHRTLPADSAGLIDKIDVQQGQIVAAGNPLVETIARDQVEVRLGVEPSEMRGLTSGQAVQLFPVSGSDTNPTAGKIRLITQRVNPDTRLVDVFVTPQNTDNLLLEGFTRAELSIGTRKALIAPRQAVLPDEDGYTLFTVKDGKAVKHTVRIGLENDQEVEVIGDDLAAGDTVVIQGNYELDDGMAVATTPAAATPAETKP